MGKVRASMLLGLISLLPSGVMGQDEQRPIVRKVREIQRDVERMRGLKFRAPVEVGVQKPEALKKMLLEEFEKEASADELRDQEKVVKALGLLPEDFDLHENLLSFLGEHIGGFYLPEKKQLFLVDRSEGGGMNAMAQQMNDPMVMAHELQHALQDQHFGLDRWFELLAEHEDRLQAYKSLTEGEAQLIGMSYMFGRGEREVDLKSINRMQNAMLKMMPQAGGAQLPPYLQENMMFPYTQGAEFFQELKRKVGWEGIPRCFSDPPASTEQVLHPEKYFGDRDQPTEIRLPSGLEKALGEDGVRELYANTLGEFNVSVLLRALGVKESQAARAAAGWDGDRFAGYETKDGRVVVVWVSTWDSEQEAAEFEACYRPALLNKRPGAWLERRGTEVTLILGSQGAELALLSRKAFRALKIEEAWQPLPGLLATPDDVDLVPEDQARVKLGELGPRASAPESPTGEVTRPAAPVAAGLQRSEELGATFVVPSGFQAGQDPLVLEGSIPSAYYRGASGAELRLLQLPFRGDRAAFVRALGENMAALEVLEQEDASLHGARGLRLLFKGAHRRDAGKRLALTALQGVDLGDQTLAVLVTVPADGDADLAKRLAREVADSLYLDQAPNLVTAQGSFERDGEVFKVIVPRVLSNEVQAEGIFHAQQSAEGAKVQVVESDPTDLPAYAARLEARIPLLGDGARVHAAGLVSRRGQEVFEIEFEVAGRRTHQLVVQAGGRLWTIACSAPTEAFDGYRWRFGHVLGHFRVQPGRRYRQPEQRQPY